MPLKGTVLAVSAASLKTASRLYHGAQEVDALLDILPSRVRSACHRLAQSQIIEVVLDMGRLPEIRTNTGWEDVIGSVVTEDDLTSVMSHLSPFGSDNRAGIAATLHRVSAIRARTGEVIGLTCRVGRAVEGTIDILRDIVASGKSILLLGKPGVGKTTMLREIARTLAEEKRVVIVDTSNEIAGDGIVPHHGVGRARRMPVPHASAQHDVMIEAVENHMPEVIIIDEIGTEREALAARTIAERGVQLIGTAHGQTLENLMNNPTLSDLIGGIASVTLGDEEAKRRGTRKTVLERKAPPTFDVLIEIRERDHYAIHTDLETTVDAILLGAEPKPEMRQRTEDGEINVEPAELGFFEDEEEEQQRQQHMAIFLYGISHDKALRAIDGLNVNASIARSMGDADVVIALKAIHRKNSSKMNALASENVPIMVVSSNSIGKVQGALRSIFNIDEETDDEEIARTEAEHTAHRVVADGSPVELAPRSSFLRRIQHQIADEHGLDSRSMGVEPNRRIRISRATNAR